MNSINRSGIDSGVIASVTGIEIVGVVAGQHVGIPDSSLRAFEFVANSIVNYNIL